MSCNKNYQETFDEYFKKRFSNHDTNKFNLLLPKCVYPYEYMDVWEKSTEIFDQKKSFLKSSMDVRYY